MLDQFESRQVYGRKIYYTQRGFLCSLLFEVVAKKGYPDESFSELNIRVRADSPSFISYSRNTILLYFESLYHQSISASTPDPIL